MAPKNRFFLLLLFCTIINDVTAQQAAPPVFIIDSAFDKDAGTIMLDDKVFYFIEKDKPVAIDDILSAGSEIKFNPGFNKVSADSLTGDFWITISVKNATSEKKTARLYFVSDRLTLYLIDSNYKKEKMQGGFILPYAKWPAMNAIPEVFDPNSYPFEIPANQATTLFARVEPMGMTSNEFTGVYLFSEKAYLYETGKEHKTIGTVQIFFCGMILMMVLFSLFIFSINRDYAYLFYGLYALCIDYYLLAATGYERLYIWGSSAPFNAVLFNTSVYGIGIFYSLFTLYFLHRDNWKLRIKKWLTYFFRFAVAIWVISSAWLLIQPDFSRQVMNFMNGVSMIVIIPGIILFLVINISYLRSKNKTARYFSLAGLSMLSGIALVAVVNLLRVIGLLPDTSSRQVDNITMMMIFEAGSTLQILLFALALSYRSRQIEKEKTELELMDTTKARFFANISHEFKTPLTLILGPAAELSKKTNDLYFKNTLAIIEKNAKRLLGLINEIMDLAKLDAGRMQMHLEHGDVIDFLKKQTLLFSSLAESKHIKLSFSSAASLNMVFDRDKLEKVINNLLSNACKYSPEGSSVSVKADIISKLKRKYLSIEIADTGMGIPADHLPHIFERFYHANQKDYTTDQPSTGIGLALTKELIEMHEGSIKVTSKLEQGTSFTILLPTDLIANADGVAVKETVNSIPVEEYTPLANGNGLQENENADEDLPQILLIEDNEELRGYIRNCLHDNYIITEAADGEEGITMATSTIPDLIITDVMMPKKDGFEVSREMKQSEKTNHIPIIILTGKSSQTSRLEGMKTEADIYLSKPFDADELRLHITNLLKSRQRMQEHYSRRLFLETSKQEVTSMDEAFLQKAIDVVEENMADENFSVDPLSKALFMDRTQLFRKLKALTNQNPSNFIRNLRLKKAKYLLENDAGTVSDIAFSVGFGSTTYFNKCFKEFYGTSPGKIKA